jgi:hypothetical protein
MPHLLDARRLVDEFAETDPHVPLVVFSILSLYFADGPFEFDAERIARRMTTLRLQSRINPTELAAMQSDLERFFEPRPDGWRPRPGVLLYTGEEAPPEHAGALPGEANPQIEH